MNLSEALIKGEGFSAGEALGEGLKVTGTGLIIVFGVLVILMIVLILMKVIFYKDPKKQAAKAEPVPAAAEAVPETSALDSDMDEDELIAVLTAAVAASLNTSTYNLQIKSYRRVGSTAPAWNRAGLNETINNRF